MRSAVPRVRSCLAGWLPSTCARHRPAPNRHLGPVAAPRANGNGRNQDARIVGDDRMILRLKRISKRYPKLYGERVALDEVSLELERGQVVGVFGSSGSR